MMLANDEPLTIEEKLQSQIDQLESMINDLDDITNTSEFRLAGRISNATVYLMLGKGRLKGILDSGN